MIGAVFLRAALVAVAASPTPVDCVAELEFAGAFLLENDAGVRAAGWREYPPQVATVLQEEKKAAATATSPESCLELLNTLLLTIRKGHIGALLSENDSSVFKPPVTPVVVARKLSPKTAYIEVPSFGSGIREQLVKIVETNQADVRSADNLIIDLRKNGGGSDSAYGPLLEMMGPATYRSLNPDMLATPANIAGWEAILPQLPEADRAEVRRKIARLKTAQSGWVPMSDSPFSLQRYSKTKVKATPKNVWVMIGPKCGSSCEQFVLAARQNPRVTLVGRKTYGTLDASNLRPVRTPSGRMTIFYATTYVRRPRGEEIDGVGISPAIELPLPADDAAFASEVATVQRMAEDARTLQSDRASPGR